MVFLGLAGVAEDERGPEGGRRFDGADLGDPPQEPLAVAPATHPGEQRPRDVLEGEVEVRHAGVEDRRHQVVGEAGRVEVEEPGALDQVGHRTGEPDDRLVPLPPRPRPEERSRP